MRASSISLLIFAVLTLPSGCEDAKPTQANLPVNEETTLSSGEPKETESPTIVPLPTAAEIDEQPSKSSPKKERNKESITRVQFPKELHGLWIGSAHVCPADSEYFDGEFLLEISPEDMFGYEETYKPTGILATSTSPKSWRIEVLIDVGPSGHFSESDPMTFALDKETLKVERGAVLKTYKKCRLKIDRDDGTTENDQKAASEGLIKRDRIKLGKPQAAYPRALWGTWRLGPGPCQLPVNPDGDGRLYISRSRIDGYETYYEPIAVTTERSRTSVWRIKSKENYLGSQVTDEVQTFELDNNELRIIGDGYEEEYVKCI